MSRTLFLTLAATLFAGAAAGQDAGFPPEPYRMVYTMASASEVVLLDLAGVERVDDVVEAWSLAFAATPVRFDDAPEDAGVFWLRSRIDCGARTGAFTRAVGLREGAVVFDIPVAAAPTPLDAGWVLDEEFLCKGVQATRIAATTMAEAELAARAVLTGATATTP